MGVAKHVARRERARTEGVVERTGERAFAGTGGAKENKTPRAFNLGRGLETNCGTAM
jgi:hypothetical protein